MANQNVGGPATQDMSNQTPGSIPLGSGAAPGSTVQVFATGLISSASGPVTARIGSREIPSPAYAGPSSFDGVQQVNIVIPADLPAADTNLAVCAVAPPSNQPVCSPPVALAIQH